MFATRLLERKEEGMRSAAGVGEEILTSWKRMGVSWRKRMMRRLCVACTYQVLRADHHTLRHGCSGALREERFTRGFCREWAGVEMQ